MSIILKYSKKIPMGIYQIFKIKHNDIQACPNKCIVTGNKCKSFGVVAYCVTFKHRTGDVEVLAGSLVNLLWKNNESDVWE